MARRRLPQHPHPHPQNLQSPQVALGKHSFLRAWFVQDMLGGCALRASGTEIPNICCVQRSGNHILPVLYFQINHRLGFWCISGRPRCVEGALRTVPFTLHLTAQRWQRCSVAGRRKSSFYRVIRYFIGWSINGCLTVVQSWATGGLWIFTLHYIALRLSRATQAQLEAWEFTNTYTMDSRPAWGVTCWMSSQLRQKPPETFWAAPWCCGWSHLPIWAGFIERVFTFTDVNMFLPLFIKRKEKKS